MITTAIVVIVAALAFWFIFRLTIGSIESLGTRISPFYPFDRVVQKGNMWSQLFYLIIIVGLGVFLFVLIKIYG
jgi:hypothetical protein